MLRAALGRAALVSRGDEEVGLAPGSLWCDVHSFESLLAEGRRVEALEVYGGDLLPSFHVSAVSADFEHWLEAERARLRAAAAAAAWSLSDERVAAANIIQAVHWARRAVSVLPEDEASIRRLLLLLERGGDRLGALPEVAGPVARRDDLAEASPAAPQAVRPESIGEASLAPAPTWAAAVRPRRWRLVATSLMLVTLAGSAALLSSRNRAARGEQPRSGSGGSAAVGTTSAVALRLYEEGQHARYRGDARSAIACSRQRWSKTRCSRWPRITRASVAPASSP